MTTRVICDFYANIAHPTCNDPWREIHAESRCGSGSVAITLPAGPRTRRTVTFKADIGLLIRTLQDLQERAK